MPMANRLATETSPYLLQHADNPVDWYPWGPEAFDVARESGKPVLLSIGYSACHWCHVMAHESFEDESTAALMNRLYVNIKLDREERPDIDKIYQTAHQLLTQRGGGWPLTMFLNPDNQKPYFGGTYFPDEARHGMPAFQDLLTKVAAYYDEQRDEVREQGDRLSDVFRQIEPEPASPETELTAVPLQAVRDRLGQTFDRDYGGFGGAPKFPHPASVEKMLRHWRASTDSAEPDIDALFMATLTLTRMAEGGLYDHLGGGFCRYSVDRYWQIPHFEKMLYDNGPLLALYSQAYLATGEQQFATTATQTANWMLTDMRSPDGGFYSTRDADSEGEEGRYYVWTPEQVATLLDAEDYAAFARHFGLDGKPNFEGQWHLSLRVSQDDIATELGRDPGDIAEAIERSREILLAERTTRIAPARDEKQLTSWNALAIRGLAISGRILERDDLIDAAASAVEFIREKLFVDGRLMANYKDGEARFAAYVDDHAFLLDALIELLQSRWNTEHLNFAVQIADLLLEQFEDTENGGFFFTANDHEQLMHRTKALADDAMPSGNGVAALALQRLGHLLGENRYIDSAERTLKSAWQAMDEFPHGHVTLLFALEEYLTPPEIIIIRGTADSISAWQSNATKLYSPGRFVFAIDEADNDLPGALALREPIAGETVAYRCLGTHCELPVTEWSALVRQLRD
jgi:uncharacterized protein YyaL (SSP411 family)